MKINKTLKENINRGSINQMMSDGEDFIYAEFLYDIDNHLLGMQVTSYLYEVTHLTFGYRFQIALDIAHEGMWEFIDVTMGHRNYIVCENSKVAEYIDSIWNECGKGIKELPPILIGKLPS